MLQSKNFTVQDCPGYNSWPMIQNIGRRLVCAYCRGTGHRTTEPERALYTRISDDGGRTWVPETLIVNTAGGGDVPIGKGRDANGDMLLWNRCMGKDVSHSLYRSPDGIHFTCISRPELNPVPIQITDIFPLPGSRLAALWFSGAYQDSGNGWGIIVSSDNGATWEQTAVESDLRKADWPTEPSVLALENGRLLAIARTENGPAQFQLESTDCGRTWKKMRTNITDVMCSTPSLIFDPESQTVFNYYYHRTKGLLKRRTALLKDLFGNPLGWSEPEIVAEGSKEPWDAGNVNAVAVDGTHYAAYYSGKSPDTAIYVAVVNQENL